MVQLTMLTFSLCNKGQTFETGSVLLISGFMLPWAKIGNQLAVRQRRVSIKVTFWLFSLVRYINLYQPHPNSEVVEILLLVAILLCFFLI